MFLVMLYVTIKLTTCLLIYKLVSIGLFFASASAFIIPLWFFLGDIIAEVYGYEVSKKLIWITIIFQVIFAILCFGIIQHISPTDWPHQAAYDQVLGNLPRVVLSSIAGITTGAFVNAYVISRWKVLLLGKYFWLRSLGVSAIGEAVFTIVVYSGEFIGVAPVSDIIKMMTISYLIKLLVAPIFIFPTLIVANLIKKFENIDTYDYNIKFNPFKFE